MSPSRCRCDSQGGQPSPGADVAGGEPSQSRRRRATVDETGVRRKTHRQIGQAEPDAVAAQAGNAVQPCAHAHGAAHDAGTPLSTDSDRCCWAYPAPAAGSERASGKGYSRVGGDLSNGYQWGTEECEMRAAGADAHPMYVGMK